MRGSGGSRISVRGMRRGSGPNFSRRDDPNFLRQIVSAHRRGQDFSDGGCAKGWIQDFWLGDDGGAGMEGPKAPNEAR